jgi:hypothetical protein
VYKVDVHLHSFIPTPSPPPSPSASTQYVPNAKEDEDEDEDEDEEEVVWEWQTQSIYPRQTLPTAHELLPPQRPSAALHLCLCGNHWWAAPLNADVWEVRGNPETETETHVLARRRT